MQCGLSQRVGDSFCPQGLGTSQRVGDSFCPKGLGTSQGLGEPVFFSVFEIQVLSQTLWDSFDFMGLEMSQPFGTKTVPKGWGRPPGLGTLFYPFFLQDKMTVLIETVKICRAYARSKQSKGKPPRTLKAQLPSCPGAQLSCLPVWLKGCLFCFFLMVLVVWCQGLLCAFIPSPQFPQATKLFG